MKAIIKAYSLLFLALCIAGAGFAHEKEPEFEKKKTLSKSYSVSSSDKVHFDNRFGELRINTWDKNEVKVDITMVAKANTEEVAQELIDRINIEEGKDGSGVHFKTRLGNENKNWPQGNKYNNTSFSINYVVYMPSRNPLQAENEFGKMIISDYAGEISIAQKFGSLTAGKLSNVKKLRIEFSGGSVIESMNGGELDIRFSRAQVGRLEGAVKVNVEHSGGVKLGLDNNLKQLTIKNSFTQLFLDAAQSLSASFDVHTNFSELNNKTSFSIREETEEDRRGPKFDHDYKGKSGSGNIPVKIRSEFGEVTIGHNISFDVNEKEEKKERSKSRTRSV